MSMSITTTGDTMLRKSFHRRNDSAELDVFEAARYFAGYNESVQPWRGGRVSFGMPDIIPQQTHVEEKHSMKEKKYKQPSSPGGRLASFLNSLFNQASSRKKKSKSIKEEEGSPGGRRRRRSSISHFRISSTTSTGTKSLYSSSSSGFRTPPPYAHRPTKCYKDLRSYSDHKQAKPTNFQNEKLKLNEGYKGKHKSVGIWLDQYPSDEGENLEFKKLDDDDDDADTDSSSDLFELQNYDLGIYSSGGLPVYETTRMDDIRRGAPISRAPL
ncbi:hypothetical protein SLA2020_025350 [Shorea laevis]